MADFERHFENRALPSRSLHSRVERSRCVAGARRARKRFAESAASPAPRFRLPAQAMLPEGVTGGGVVFREPGERCSTVLSSVRISRQHATGRSRVRFS